MISIAVDVGGTFTDVVLVNSKNNTVYTDKITSTPGSSDAVVAGVHRLTARAGVKPSDISVFVHGFTIATNAWLTRTGARVVLAVTEGFKDVLEIGTQRRPLSYSLTQQKIKPLTPRSQVLEVNERTDAFGNLVKELSTAASDEIADRIAHMNPEAVAISFLFSHLNNSNELRLQEALKKRLPDIPVYCSAIINPQVQEYPRTNTTVTAAYVGPAVDQYLRHLETSLREVGMHAPCLLMRSDGGIATMQSARDNPVSMLLSGPAGGVMAANHISNTQHIPNIITLDMGGTSADFSLIHNHEAIMTMERDVHGETLRIPALDISTISSGGGSIGSVDMGGAIRVGPESAGSVPGPAAYDKGGTKPTLTDAILTLGLMSPETKMADGLKLNIDRAQQAIQNEIAKPLASHVKDAAFGMFAIANTQMAQAIRALSVEKGYDPREFSLLSGGGAGSIFAPFLMQELGMKEVIIPSQPGVFSAAGLLLSDLRYSFQQPFEANIDAVDPDEFRRLSKKLEAQVRSAFKQDNIAPEKQAIRYLLDIRYVGQMHELTVPLTTNSNEIGTQAAAQAIKNSFYEVHERSYGFADATQPCEIINIRIEGIGSMPKHQIGVTDGHLAKHSSLNGAAWKFREVYLGHTVGYVQARVGPRSLVPQGQYVNGPLIIEQPDTTIVVLPGQKITALADDTLRITVQ